MTNKPQICLLIAYGGRVVVQQINAHITYKHAGVSPTSSIHSPLPADASWQAANNGPGVCACGAHVGDSDGVPSSWL